MKGTDPLSSRCNDGQFLYWEQGQLAYRTAKAAKDFIPGGTTRNDFQLSARMMPRRHLEVSGFIQAENWKAPIYKPGRQSDVSSRLQIIWLP